MAAIAIIDDDEATREVLQILLHDEAYTVQLFSSGKEFLVAFKPKLFSLILMDLTMPHMDGYELLTIVRGADPTVPVMAVTANAYQYDRDKAYAAGFSDFVTKPFTDLPAFFDLIIKHLREN